MRVFPYTLDGRPVMTMFPERPADLGRFWDFIDRAGSRRLGFDTETTGLDIYGPNHRARTVQFGSFDMGEAWVLPVEWGSPYVQAARRVLSHPEQLLVAHNVPYDAQVVDRHLGVPLESLMPRTRDTRIHAHLLDPRAKSEGGLGLRLKDLAAVYVDGNAPDTEDGLTAVFRSLKLTKDVGFARVPLENEVYLSYAGLDTLLVSALDERLLPAVEGINVMHLSEFEHRVALILAILQRRGMLIDVEYTSGLVEDLRVEGERWTEVAASYGLRSINSPAQVAAQMLAMGETLTERTDSGAYKVDRAVLLALADLNGQWKRIGAREPNPVAEAVVRAKRADKWRVAYAEAILNGRDAADRVHPSLGGLMARTARMSVSNPPLQQLPSSDWTIRRAFVANPGMSMAGIDFQAVEMRVLAGLADVKAMRKAIDEGRDLHSFTVAMVEGMDPAEVEAMVKANVSHIVKSRKLLKGVGFGKVYGGGATTLARQTGADIDNVKRAIEAYDRVYPEIRKYSKAIQRAAQFGKREVVTPTGRHLPMDRDRSYAGLNYMVQSTARDLLAQALVNVHDAGLLDHVLLPIHDELLIQAPAEDIAEVTEAIRRQMETEFRGVPIGADGEVFGRSWGYGYGAPQ
jgi:DNA polymerase-1